MDTINTINTIITHDSSFNCGVIAGCTLLKILYPDARILRTNDHTLITNNNRSNIILDVGNIYNPSKRLFDHHQESFDNKFNDNFISPMGSCGLIWFHYGKDIIDAMARNVIHGSLDSRESREYCVEYIFDKYYSDFIYAIDCNDKGICNKYDMENYKPYELSKIVLDFNSHDDDECNGNFNKCIDFMNTVIKQTLSKLILESNSFMKNYYYIKDLCMNNNGSEFLIIDKELNITDHLSIFDVKNTIKFVICVIAKNIFTIKALGKRYPLIISEDKAKRIIGNDLIFIHKERFTGATKSLNGAIYIVDASLKLYHNSFISNMLNLIDKYLPDKIKYLHDKINF